MLIECIDFLHFAEWIFHSDEDVIIYSSLGVYKGTLLRLINWIVFYAVSAIFQPYKDGDY